MEGAMFSITIIHGLSLKQQTEHILVVGIT
jgi:hypothetical protein